MPKKLEKLHRATFNINEKRFPELQDLRHGQTINAILTYKVIEKTKNYVVLKIGHVTTGKILRVY